VINEAANSMFLPEIPEGIPLYDQSFDPRSVPCLDQLLPLEVKKLQEKYSSITIRFEGNAPAERVHMHPVWVSHVLKHLVVNAVRVLTTKTEIASQRKITVRTRLTEEGMLEVQVEDNGPGLRPELIKDLFKKPIRSEKHIGRGLMLVQFIVSQHGGRMWLEHNEPGEGACFAFNLPRVIDRKELGG